jgi:hypothetical protein
MMEVIDNRTRQEFDPLTDSLASRVRWRVSDYEEIFRAEIDLLLAVERSDARVTPNLPAG